MTRSRARMSNVNITGRACPTMREHVSQGLAGSGCRLMARDGKSATPGPRGPRAMLTSPRQNVAMGLMALLRQRETIRLLLRPTENDNAARACRNEHM